MIEKTVNVLVVRARRGTAGDEFETKWIPRMRAVSPLLNIRDVSELVFAEQEGDSTATDKLDKIFREADAFYGYQPPANFIARAPNLKWMACALAGVDPFLIPEIINSPIILTNSRIHATQVSEAAFTHMIMLAKRAPVFMQQKQDRVWKGFIPGLLRGRTVGILGLGNIGREFARMCKSFGMEVIGMKARVNENVENVDRLLPPSGLGELLKDSDFVVIILPLTAETRNLIGEGQLRLMKSTAYLVNVGRGAIINEDALFRALQENWIAGAGLDVFATEPLPADNRLWGLPNIIITPHFAGRRENYNELTTSLYCENLKRFLNGEQLLSVVDKKRGY